MVHTIRCATLALLVTLLPGAAPAATPKHKAPARAAAHLLEDDLAARVLATLSLDERVGQLVVAYPPIDAEAPVAVGSVIFVGNLLRSAPTVRARIESLQRRSRVPLLVSVDMEGGKYNRLKFLKSLRAVPSAQELGQGDEKAARAWGRRVGHGMRSLGFNCNLGPVLDLADSGLMFESGRSMGGDPATVGKLARAYARGLWAEGVAPIGKHFPGYGDLEQNSDHHLILTERPSDEIARHAGAFTLAGDSLAGVMLANVGFTAFGGVPAIFSPELVELAHKGGWLTITDDLSVAMLAEVTGGDQAEVVRRAFLAGNDLMLTTAPADWDKGMNAFKVLLELVRSRPELVARVDASALRVLRLKQRLGLLEPLRRELDAQAKAARESASQTAVE